MTLKRAVCLNCIDGRTQLPVIHWIKDNFPVDYVDMITEPGMDGLLAGDVPIENITRKIQISIEKNHASLAFVVGHHDCKRNPVSSDDHKKHILHAVDRIIKEFPQISVTGIWVNEKWESQQLG